MPDGAKAPPHWHPVDEHVTVISGTLLFGVGDRFDEPALRTAPRILRLMSISTRHFPMVKGETVTQQNGIGAFQLIYVNAADDPSRNAGSVAPQKPHR